MASYVRGVLHFSVATAASALNTYFYVLGAMAGILEGCLTQYLYLFPGGHWVVKKLGIGYTSRSSLDPMPPMPASENGDWQSESSMGAGVLRAPREEAASPNFELLSFPLDSPDSDSSPTGTATLIGHEALELPAADDGAQAAPHAIGQDIHRQLALNRADGEHTPSTPASMASNDTAMDDGRHKQTGRGQLRRWLRPREKNDR